MKRLLVALALIVPVAAAGGVALLWAARSLPFFRVRQVELMGVRYLAPDVVLAGLGLAREQSVFDPTGPIQDRALRIAGVVSARVHRRLPGSLRIEIVERVPVALAPSASRMVALDAEGQRLPYDPAATGLDLPVIPSADTLVARALSVISATDTVLYRDVLDARRGPGATVALRMSGRRRVLLRGVPSSAEIRAVSAVRQQLRAGGLPFEELDARYAGWVVVRRSGS